MHSHQQHLFWYCMLPHSKPHVPTVKQYPSQIQKAFLSIYKVACDLLIHMSSGVVPNRHPFSVEGIFDITGDSPKTRKSLRTDLYNHLLADDLNTGDLQIMPDEMFESCTMQPAGRLGFHQDMMNCPSMDNTITVHLPKVDQVNPKCILFLFYSRKCAGHYSKQQETVDTLLGNHNNCPLTRLCLRSLLETEGIFNYQGAIFETHIFIEQIITGL